jgi:multisubunit Na+/H+ antiporter MnhF subunit
MTATAWQLSDECHLTMLAYAFPPLTLVLLTCAALVMGVAASVLIVVTVLSIIKGNTRSRRILVADGVAVAALAVCCLLRVHLYPEQRWDLRLFDWLVLVFMLLNRRSG